MLGMTRKRCSWRLVGSLSLVIATASGASLATPQRDEGRPASHGEITSGRSPVLDQIVTIPVPGALGRSPGHGENSIRREEIWQALAGHPAPTWEVMQAIITASARTGIDLGLLMAAAWKESVFRPGAAAPNSSARGLFQFTTQTWREALVRHGSRLGLPTPSTTRSPQDALIDNRRFDPAAAALVAAEMIRNDGESVARSLGRPITQTEAFLTHFLGRAGAERFLRAVATTPNRDVRDVIPTAFSNNRARFPQGRGPITVQASYDHLMNILESRRILYLQILRLEIMIRQNANIEFAANIRE
jgi:hypothetical protein